MQESLLKKIFNDETAQQVVEGELSKINAERRKAKNSKIMSADPEQVAAHEKKKKRKLKELNQRVRDLGK